MYEQDLDIQDADDVPEIPVPQAVIAKTSSEAAASIHSSNARNAVVTQSNARARLEEVREERALRKAIYDDLYCLDSDD
jgi:hypothetical protein